MSVTSETATVYRGGGRRWFTANAAYRAEAKAIIKRRCECSKGDMIFGDPPYTCHYHADPDKYQQRIRLLVRMFIKPASEVSP